MDFRSFFYCFGAFFEVLSEHIHPDDRERMVKKVIEIQKEGGNTG
jgi:hypothetical protein